VRVLPVGGRQVGGVQAAHAALLVSSRS
jgi:hypothetical protein